MKNVIMILALIATAGFTADAQAAQVCRDGDQAVFTEPSDDEGGSQTVVRTCKDGRWYPKAAPVTPIKCVEGRKYPMHERVQNGSDDELVLVWRTCENGRLYPKAPAPKIIKCKEGKQYVFQEQSEDGEGNVLVTKTCQNGKLR